MARQPQQLCTQCYYQGLATKPGSGWIELLLWLAWIFPGLLYSLWRRNSKRSMCPVCHAKAMIPLMTLRAREILGGKPQLDQSPFRAEARKLAEIANPGPHVSKTEYVPVTGNSSVVGVARYIVLVMCLLMASSALSEKWILAASYLSLALSLLPFVTKRLQQQSWYLLKAHIGLAFALMFAISTFHSFSEYRLSQTNTEQTSKAAIIKTNN